MADSDNPTQDQRPDKMQTVEPAHNPQKRRGEFSPGDHIDHYVIRDVLGEGGFAVVYLAEQTKPVRRRVALKVIKPGMDTRPVIARF